ncbi:winged helix-turn-helix transcriptional regulator, partial [Acinetobacter baumannii]|uniref:winged helix-turn-helix transcriptional regulator n=1 Tax=Acinetobacter baumannii TaxID=470 RepID=UPI001FF25B7E
QGYILIWSSEHSLRILSLRQTRYGSRFVHPVVPPKVEYSVTTLGFSLSPICKQLCDWGEKHLKEEETNNQKNQLKQK